MAMRSFKRTFTSSISKWCMSACLSLVGMNVFADNASVIPNEIKPVLKLYSSEDPPHVFQSKNTEPGLSVRYVNTLMERVGIEYEHETLPLKRGLLQTYSTPNTCVFPVERSQERESKLDWISPVSISRYGLYQEAEKDRQEIRVLNDAKGFRIGSILGTGMSEYLNSWGFEVDVVSSQAANIIKLKANRIDLLAIDDISARFISAHRSSDLGEPLLVFFTTLRALGCHPDMSDFWVDRLNDELHAMYKDGTIEEINKIFRLNMKNLFDKELEEALSIN